MPTTTTFINARLPIQLADQLRARAQLNDRSVSAEVRRAVANHLVRDTEFEHRTSRGNRHG